MKLKKKIQKFINNINTYLLRAKMIQDNMNQNQHTANVMDMVGIFKKI